MACGSNRKRVKGASRSHPWVIIPLFRRQSRQGVTQVYVQVSNCSSQGHAAYGPLRPHTRSLHDACGMLYLCKGHICKGPRMLMQMPWLRGHPPCTLIASSPEKGLFPEKSPPACPVALLSGGRTDDGMMARSARTHPLHSHGRRVHATVGAGSDLCSYLQEACH